MEFDPADPRSVRMELGQPLPVGDRRVRGPVEGGSAAEGVLGRQQDVAVRDQLGGWFLLGAEPARGGGTAPVMDYRHTEVGGGRVTAAVAGGDGVSGGQALRRYVRRQGRSSGESPGVRVEGELEGVVGGLDPGEGVGDCVVFGGRVDRLVECHRYRLVRMVEASEDVFRKGDVGSVLEDQFRRVCCSV